MSRLIEAGMFSRHLNRIAGRPKTKPLGSSNPAVRLLKKKNFLRSMFMVSACSISGGNTYNSRSSRAIFS